MVTWGCPIQYETMVSGWIIVIHSPENSLTVRLLGLIPLQIPSLQSRREVMIKFIQKLFGSIRWKVIKSFWLLFQTVSANGWSLTVFSSQKKTPRCARHGGGGDGRGGRGRRLRTETIQWKCSQWGWETGVTPWNILKYTKYIKTK